MNQVVEILINWVIPPQGVKTIPTVTCRISDDLHGCSDAFLSIVDTGANISSVPMSILNSLFKQTCPVFGPVRGSEVCIRGYNGDISREKPYRLTFNFEAKTVVPEDGVIGIPKEFGAIGTDVLKFGELRLNAAGGSIVFEVSDEDTTTSF